MARLAVWKIKISRFFYSFVSECPPACLNCYFFLYFVSQHHIDISLFHHTLYYRTCEQNKRLNARATHSFFSLNNIIVAEI